MNQQTKENLTKIKDGFLEAGSQLASFSYRGLKGLGEFAYKGLEWGAPRARNAVNKVGPYVLPNAAALALLDSGIEGYDSVLDFSEKTEGFALGIGTAALAYMNGVYFTNALREKVSGGWAKLGSNQKLVTLALGAFIAYMPQTVRDGTFSLWNRGENLVSVIQHGTLDDKAIAEEYARYQTSSRRPWEEVEANMIPNDKFAAGRVIGTRRHQGLDEACEIADPVYPIGAGRITEVKDYEGTGLWRNGKTVRFKVAEGLEVTYLHLSEFGDVEVKDEVTPNTVIGYCGATGNASEDHPHVHIQIDDHVGSGGRVLNPTNFLNRSRDEYLQSRVETLSQTYMPFYRRIAEMDGYKVEEGQ